MDMPDVTTLAHGVVSEDKSQAIFLVSQLAMPDYTFMAPLRVAGLEAAGARYQVTLLDHPDIQITGEGGHTMRKLPEWMVTPQTVSGEWLQQAGAGAANPRSGKRHFDWPATRVMVTAARRP